MKKIMITVSLLVGAFSQASLANESVTECSVATMTSAITQAFSTYAMAAMADRRIEVEPGTLEIQLKGTGPIVDDSLMDPKVQNVFDVHFKTKRGSEMAMVTPGHGLCDGRPQFCFFVPKENLLAVPDPVVKEHRDSEGIVVSRSCDWFSHAGINRYLLIVNRTQNQVVHDDLISYSHPIWVSVPMR